MCCINGAKTIFFLLLSYSAQLKMVVLWLCTVDNDEINKLLCPDDLTKYFHLPSHSMDEEEQTINEKLQCLGPLPISYQTIDSSSKPALTSLEALQKGH